MNRITNELRSTLVVLAERAADAILAVNKNDRKWIAKDFIEAFTNMVEKRETREQISVMEYEGCPNMQD